MATPTSLTAEMVKAMADSITKEVEHYRPRKSLLMSEGFKRELMSEKFRAETPTVNNPLLTGYSQTLMGIPVETFNIPPEEVIDWSGCRSPSRAKRRHARGFPQRTKIEYRERAYLINRDALRFDLVMDARLFASIYDVR